MSETRTPDPTGFGKRLKELREAAGLTQQELADRAGMHKFGVAKVEQGHRGVSWEKALDLARALGVSILLFVPDTEADKPAAKTTKRRKQRGGGE